MVRALAGAALVLALAGCTAPAPEPVVVMVDSLDGQRIEVAVGNTIVVNTDDHDIEGYAADIADPAVVEFDDGADAGDFGQYPAFTALAPRTTAVTLTGSEIEPIEFTVLVGD